MNEDRIEGTVKKAGGAVEEAAGKIVGDEELETKGILNQAVGTVQDGYGKVRDKVKDLIEDAPAAARTAIDTSRDYARRGSVAVTRAAGDNGNLSMIAVGAAVAVAGAALSWFLLGRKKGKPGE
jgi:uncharacterized protein YjbJ (UPF0337 family)